MKNWFKKNKRESFVFRSQKVLRDIDTLVEKAKSDYSFMMLMETTKEDINIEIKIQKAEQCSSNWPKIFINGKDMVIPYSGDLPLAIRRSIEQYQLDKV